MISVTPCCQPPSVSQKIWAMYCSLRLRFHFSWRESHRSLNQAHHYWSYQLTDEKCECENGEEDEDGAALPPHK